MAVRRLYEPLCIAFGTTVSSPTVPTYQLYDLPHKFTPRLYMESEDPNLVLREIGVWAGWEQAGSANTRLFLLDLLKDEDAHDKFLLREAGPTRFRRVRGIIVLTQKHLRIVQTKGSRLGGLRFQLTYQQACLVHGTKGARGPREQGLSTAHGHSLATVLGWYGVTVPDQDGSDAPPPPPLPSLAEQVSEQLFFLLAYIDGGDLQQWIDGGQLYDGSKSEAQARVLRVAAT